MAYQQFYPNYQTPYQNPYLAQNQPQMMQAQQSITPSPQTPQTTQNGDFYVVPNEDAVLRWPVAPGSLVTFKIENQPVLIEKSLGFSKFDSPHYDRFKLVKEEMAQKEEKPGEDKYSALEDRIQALSADFTALKEQVTALEAKKPGRPKKEDSENE